MLMLLVRGYILIGSDQYTYQQHLDAHTCMHRCVCTLRHARSGTSSVPTGLTLPFSLWAPASSGFFAFFES